MTATPNIAKIASGLTLALLAGCSAPDGQRVTADSNVRVWTDGETGCRFLIYDRKAGYARMGGITPKLRRDGKPDCPDSHLIQQEKDRG